MPEQCVFSLKVNQLREVLSVCFCQPFLRADVRALAEHALLSRVAGISAGHLLYLGRSGGMTANLLTAKNLNLPLTENTLGNTVPQVKREPGELKQAA